MQSSSALPSDSSSPHGEAPFYSPSGPPPTYCSRASGGEEVLAQTFNANTYRTPSGSYIKDFGRIKVSLIEQEDGTDVPSYDRGGVISGTVDIQVDNPEDILRVELQIEGKLKLNVSGTNAVSKTLDLLDQNYQLWSRRQSPTASDTDSLCPGVLSFSSILPLRYHEEDPPRDSPLPPSYEVDLAGVPGLAVKCTYCLKFTLVTRGTLWDKRKSFYVPFKYRPRRRSPQPVLLNDIDGRLLDTIKLHPQEWFQTTNVLQARPSTKLPPIDVQLFIPSIKIFALSDTIPFHIQLIGPKVSLNKLFAHLEFEEEGYTSSTTSSDTVSLASSRAPSSLSTKASRKAKDDHLALTMGVSIHRQVGVKIKGQQVWKTHVLAVGKMKALPPSFECGPPPSPSLASGNASSDSVTADNRSTSGVGCPYASKEQDFLRCLDWEGEVRLRDDVCTGGFDSGRVTVNDFIVLRIMPRPHQNQAAFLPLRTAVSITLVTDSFNDGMY